MRGISASLVGRVAVDPEMTYNPENAAPRTRVRLAVRDFVAGAEATHWLNVNFYGPAAENVNNNVRKGFQIAVVGRLVPEEYTRRDGTPATGLTVHAYTSPQIVDWGRNYEADGQPAADASTDAEPDAAAAVDAADDPEAELDN